MSSPNTPDHNPTNGQNQSSGEPGPQGPGTPGPSKGGGMVPPWQRGTGGGQAGDGPNGTPRQGPPPHGIVSADDPTPGNGPAPITKLDDPRNAPQGPVQQDVPPGPPAGHGDQQDENFVESPTRTIERDDLPGEKLPNLDAIHHVGAPQAAAPAAVRVAPAEIGATRALRAAVQVRRIDPWATFKISAVLAVVGFFIWMIAVALLYLILDGMGVWDQINSSFATIATPDGSSSESTIGAGTIFGWSMLLGAINAILLTAIATIGAYIYNICADLIGGAEITIADLD